MDLTENELNLIQDEIQALKSVRDSLRSQMAHARHRLGVESARSRELTSKLVRATRDDDKQQMASDEAVSHSLRKYAQNELKVLERLLKKPYFARIILEENTPQGVRHIEYKLGFSENSDCRIIDWRRAPLARLYYEYKEGDEYSELIQDKERNGRIVHRVKVDIEDQELKLVSCRYGTFIRENDTWTHAKNTAQSRFLGSREHLPSILSLITPEQYETITQEADTALLIQGVAGSGKTSVALHRLAFLLHKDNSDFQPKDCAIILLSKPLKHYISQTLPSLEVSGVSVLTYSEWTEKLLRQIANVSNTLPHGLRRPNDYPSPGIRRVMNSMAVLKCTEEYVQGLSPDSFAQPYTNHLIHVLANSRAILEHDETKLLDRELIEKAKARLILNDRTELIDYCCDPLILRLHQALGGTPYKDNGERARYKHIIVDEIQDFSPPQLASIIDSVDEIQHLTLVGDTAQAVSSSSAFPGWEKLRQHWSLSESLSAFVTLTVSHRSTTPIIKFADAIHGSRRTMQGRDGKRPLWIKCLNENSGVEESIAWLLRVMEKYPGTTTAVACRTEREAKYVFSLLEPTFQSVVSLGTHDSFSFEEGILVTEVSQLKGLEFPHVLLWNPSQRAYPKADLSRNLLYVAATRAQENLCLVTWERPSPILPHFRSKLARCHDLTEVD